LSETAAIRRRPVLQTGLAIAHVAVLFNAGAYIAMLPRVAGGLGVPPSFGTWTQTNFMIGLALGLPLSGALTARWGLERTARNALLAFAAASAGCVAAESLVPFLAGRIVLGLAGGVLLPASQKLSLSTFPEHRKDFGLTLWGLLALTPFSLGTAFGGWLAEEAGWRWLFYLNVPIALLAAATIPAAAGGAVPAEDRPRFDVVGFALAAVALFGAQTLLNQGNDLDWLDSDWLASLAVSVALAAAWLLLRTRTTAQPFLPLNLLARRNVAIGAACLTLGFLCFQGLLSLLIVQSQLVLGYSSSLAGLMFLPLFVLAKPGAWLAQALSRRIDARPLACANLAGFALVYFWFSRFDTPASFDHIFWPKLAEGLCLGTFFAPLTAILLHGLPPAEQGRAAELAGLLRLAAGAFGITLAGVVLYRRTPFHQSRWVEQLTRLDPQTLPALKQLMRLGYSETAALARLTRTVTQHAAIVAINEAFWLAGWIFLALAGLVWLAHPTRPHAAPSRREAALEELLEEP
jgi:DHA2 family multidrug resistance protein